MRVRTALPLAAVLILVPALARATPEANLATHLTGDEEVPARDTQAQGQATFNVAKDGHTVEFKLVVANIENVVASHVHCGDPGVNGPIVVGLYSAPSAGGPIEGPIAEGSFDGTAFTCNGMSLLDAMRAGHTYVNVHTNDGDATPNEGPGDFPGGEIRGQV